MAKKKGKRALFNSISRLPKKLWTQSTFLRNDYDGSLLRCDLGHVGLELGVAPRIAGFSLHYQADEIRRRIFNAYDVDDEQTGCIEVLNDVADTFESNLDSVKGLLVHGLDLETCKLIAIKRKSLGEAIQEKRALQRSQQRRLQNL
jgi:hypothetical protein